MRKQLIRRCLLSATAVISMAASLPAPAVAAEGDPAWLTRVNDIRTANGLAPVAVEPAWNEGIAAHLKYIRLTPPEYKTGEYANAHRENPASPYYTVEGDNAGRSSNLTYGSRDELDAVNAWLAAPFHAIGMLRPGLNRIGLYRDPVNGSAGQDVIRGLGSAATPTAVVFPGPGTTTDLVAFRGESPNPLEPCGYSRAGLPLIAMLTAPPTADLRAELTLPNGQTLRGPSAELCVITADTWRSSDTVYGPTGASILRGGNAVLVIPPSDLGDGQHAVRLMQSGQPDVAWSFLADPPNVVPSVSVNPYVVKFGQAADVTVTGSPGATVDLYIRKVGGDFIKIRDGLVLDANGTVTVATRPDMNLRFMAKDRTVTQGSSVGGVAGLMTVQKYISINVSRVGTRRYTFTGSINPLHPGATVSLYRSGTLIRSGLPVSSSRTYTYTTVLPAGSHSFDVRTGTSGYNNASTSPTRTVSVY